MALDFLGVMIGADDTQYRETLARAQNSGAQFAGRMSQMIRSQTVGFAKLGLAITGVGALFGLVGGVVSGVVALSDKMASAHDRAIIAAESHADRMRELRDTYESVGRAVAEFGGAGKGELAARFEEIERRIDKAASAMRKAKAEASMAVASGSGGFASFLRDLQSRPMETIFAPGMVGRESRRQLDRDIEAMYAARRGLLELERKPAELNTALEMARARASGEFASRTELDLLHARGDLLNEQLLQEGRLTDERRRRIDDIAGDDIRLYDRLLALENERHSASVRHIEDEDRKRREADAEREDRERRRIELQRFEADLSEEQYEVERRRLAHDQEGADALEREIDHRRRLRDIVEREGIDENQRRRLTDLENRNYMLRAGVVADSRPKEAFRTFDARLAFAGREARQALGGGARSGDAGAQIALTTGQILDEVRRLLRPGTIKLVLGLPN